MYRPEIDGLRAIAVLSVIINHFDEMLLPNGHLGVDIFFVISGFFITQSLLKREYGSFRDIAKDFYAKRVKRIVPALFFCIAVTSLLSLVVLPPGTLPTIASLRTGIAALFGLSNLYLLRQATDYFGSSAELNPFTHTWSLGVEEQFYLLFPFLFWFGGLARHRTTKAIHLLWIISITGIASLSLYFWLSKSNPIMAFYIMPTRFWELSLGSIAYIIQFKNQKGINAFPRLSRLIPVPVFVLLLISLYAPQAQSNQAFFTFVVVTLTAVFIMVLQPLSSVYRLLALKPVVFLGAISYSLYLWHWSVLTISRWTIGINLWTIPFQFSAIFFISVFSYILIEKPLRHSEWNVLRYFGIVRERAISQAFFLALCWSGIILFWVIPLHNQGHFYKGGTASLIKKGVNTLRDNENYKGYPWIGNECTLAYNSDVGKNITPHNCTFGNFDTAKRRFLVIGDSFSAAELEMYKVLFEEGYGSVTVTSCWGASAVPEIKNNGQYDKANNYYWNFIIPILIDKLLPGDFVLMINDGSGFSPKRSNKASKQKMNRLREGLSRISDELMRKGVSIIYQHGNPFMRESKCTPDIALPQWWHFLKEPPCNYYSRNESLERRRYYNDLLTNLENKHSNFHILDLFDVFCPTSVCKFYNEEGILLYRDEWSHPSVEACLISKPLLIKTVENAILNMSLKSANAQEGSHSWLQ
jgi:peptidoglycan/LPS O-acetylase OafA/YrhL